MGYLMVTISGEAWRAISDDPEAMEEFLACLVEHLDQAAARKPWHDWLDELS